MEKIKYKINSAFTLAENLVVLTIMGIIILLVLPKMLQNNMDKKNKVILRKAVMTYESVLNQAMTSYTGIRDVNTLNRVISSDGCKYARNILAVEVINNDNSCIFETTDGIWWNMTTPNEVYLSVADEDSLTLTNASDTNDKKTFFISYTMNNNSVSILNIPSSAEQIKKNALSKTTNFLISK